MAHELMDLPYDYSALEPHIDAQTMEIHHSKHHQGYVNKLNAALEDFHDLQEKTLEELLGSLKFVPEEIKTAVINNGGGVFNHNFFWKSMSPDGGGEPGGALKDAITTTFGSFEAFKQKFGDAAATRFGSGWAWLLKNSSGELEVVSTANQDCPISDGKTPMLCLDVWEHAYYLHYQNRRPDYIAAWWKVVNWKEVEENYGV